MEGSEEEFRKPLGVLEETDGGTSRFPDTEEPLPVAEAGLGRAEPLIDQVCLDTDTALADGMGARY